MSLSIPLYSTPIPAFALLDTLNQLINYLNLQGASVTNPQFTAGAGTASYNPLGAIYVSSTAGNTGADTTEDVLQTFSLPANSLNANNKGVRIRVWGSCAANANNKTMKLYFGASVITTPTAGTNAKNWYLEMTVLRTGAATQIANGTGIVDTTAVTPYVNAGTDDNTTALTIKCTGTNGTSSANDISCKAMIVDYIG